MIVPSTYAQYELVQEHTELFTDGLETITRLDTCDIDNDGITEIIMLGQDLSNGNAELRVGHWDGEIYSDMVRERWQIREEPTHCKAIACADLDDDGSSEIVTVADSSQTELRIWEWNEERSALATQSVYVLDDEQISINDIILVDCDNDGSLELIAGGLSRSVVSGIRDTFPLTLWMFELEDGNIDEAAVHSWTWTLSPGEQHPPHINGVVGVAAADLDRDGSVEIVSVGQLNNEFDIRVWHCDSTTFDELANEQYGGLAGGSEAQGVAVGNLNSDDFLEIAVVGTTFRSDESDPLIRSYGAITAWSWHGDELLFLGHDIWQSSQGNVEWFGVSLYDRNNMQGADIIAVGPVHVELASNALRVCSLERGMLDLQEIDTEEWSVISSGSFTYAVHTADIDNDGSAEILSCGRARAQGELDIWGVEPELLPIIPDRPPRPQDILGILIGFMIGDPLLNNFESLSQAKDGPIKAAAFMKGQEDRNLFVISVPNADSRETDTGTVLFFDEAGKIVTRIDGQVQGEQLGQDMDVRQDEVVAISKQRLIRIRSGKVIYEMPLKKGLLAKGVTQVAFTDDIDGDKRPEIAVETFSGTVDDLKEVGSIQIIGSESGKVIKTFDGRIKKQYLGEAQHLIYMKTIEASKVAYK